MTLHLNIRNIRENCDDFVKLVKFSSSRDRPKSLKQVVTAIGERCMCHGSSIGDDHYNQMYHVNVGVAR